MPNPKSKRTIVLQSSHHASTVASLFATLDASFKTTGMEANTFDDASVDGHEKTRYRMQLFSAAGTDVGEVTLRLIARGDVLQDDVTIAKSMAREELEPIASAAPVTLLAVPAASFERVWKQAALDREDRESVDHLCTLDVRVRAAAGHTVTQSVTTQDDDQLVLAYTWQDPSGAAVVTGRVTLETGAEAGAEHRLGRIRVTDNDPTTDADRFG